MMDARSLHGLVVIDKPPGPTSRDVVDRVQRCLPRGVRLGHAGTLDPLASGVLVVCVGVATRFIEFVQRMDKTYRTTARLGARSTTDDAEGSIQEACVPDRPEAASVARCLAQFVGDIEQVPPAFSAARIGGRRAYRLARAGQAVSLAPRRVRIYGIDLLSYCYPRLDLEVRCGRGTYIRSLVRDLGERLGCGALVEALRRTATGPFNAGNALPLNAFESAPVHLLPTAAALADIPRLSVSAEDAGRLRHGQTVAVSPSPEETSLISGKNEVAAFDLDGVLVGIGKLDVEQRLLRPVKIVPAGE